VDLTKLRGELSATSLLSLSLDWRKVNPRFGRSLIEPESRPEEAVTIQPLSLLFTGQMADLPGRQVPRFPPQIVDAVWAEIAKRISYHVRTHDKNDVKGFASVARQ